MSIILEATLAEIQRISQLLYQGKQAPTLREYTVHVDLTTGAQTARELQRSKQTWKQILHGIGLNTSSAFVPSAARTKKPNRYPYYWEGPTTGWEIDPTADGYVAFTPQEQALAQLLEQELVTS